MKYRNLLLGLLTLLSNNLLASTAPKQIQISEVEILPISQTELEKYNYKANEFWIDGTDLVNDFSIKSAQEFYTTLYDILSKNFLYPVSYQEITNKILEGLSGFVEKITMTATDNRILIYDKNLKLIGNYKKTAEDDIENWVNILINTILGLRQNNKKMSEAHQEQIYYITTLYLLKSLDENANYIDPVNQKQKDENKNSTTLGFTYRKTTFGLQVLSILKDSPVYFSEIRTGDIITHINEIPTRSLTDEQLEYILNNTQKDILHLNYVPYISNKPTEIFIRKNEVIIPSANINSNFELPILNIHNFKTNSSKEIKNTIDTISQKENGLIIDLRGNMNGEAIEAIETANLFLNGNEMLKTYGRNENSNQTYTAKSGDILNNKPIVIIVDNTTKGTAELFTSILEGTKRAVVIGSPTFGKGNISETFKLPNNSSIYFATKSISNAKNKSFDKIGIIPIICTSTITSVDDIKTLQNNIKNDDFEDNRPTTNDNSKDAIEKIRKTCPALYPTNETEELMIKTAISIIKDSEVYSKLSKK